MPESSLVIDLDARRAIRGLNQVEKEMKDVERQGNKVEKEFKDIEKSTKSLGGTFGKLGGLIKGGLAGLIGGATISAFGRVTDQFKNLESQIKLVTDSEQELIATQSRLDNLAEQTQASYASTVTLFTRLSRATDELGISQQDLFDTTEALNLAFKVSGTSATEAENAIIQLSQGLASGALRGDEFNSVAEQAPRILAAVAKELDVTTGELRALAAEGKITSEVIVNALTGSLVELKDEASQVEPTLAGAFQGLSDNIGQFVSDLDEATGASDLFILAVNGISSAIKEVQQQVSITNRLESLFPDTEEVRKAREELNDLRDTVKGLTADRNFLQNSLSANDQRRAAELTERIKVLEEQELAAINALNNLIDKENETTISPDKVTPPPDGGGGNKETAAERARRLREEAAALREKNAALDEVFAAEDALNKAIFDRSDELVKIEEANRALLDTYLDSVNPMNEYARQLEEIDRLIELYPEHADALINAQFEIGASMEKSTETVKKNAEETNKVFEQIGRQAEGQLGNTIFSVLEDDADSSFESILSGWTSMLNRMVSEALASNIAGLFTGGGGTEGGFGGFIGSLFGGARANGGPVDAGKAYLVNENTPRSEIFIPNTAGTIVPAGAGSTVINMNISGVTDAGSFQKSEPQIMARLMGRLNQSKRNA